MKQNGETLYFLEKLTLRLDSQTQCFLFNVQYLWSYNGRKLVIFTKKRSLQWTNLYFGRLGVYSLI